MVFPLIIAGGLAGVTAWIADKTGIIDIEDAGEEIGEVVGKVIAGVVSSLPEVIEEAGPAIVDGVSEGAKATRESLRGREAALAMGVTVIAISLCCYWAIRSSLTTPRMEWNSPAAMAYRDSI
jgi:hypothetical protein